MDHQLLIQLCDEYALGLLDGPERAELEAMLAAGNRDARAQLRKSEEFVAQIALAAPAATPPASLRARLIDQVVAGGHPAPRPVAAPAAPVVDISAVRPAAAAKPARAWAAGWAVAAALAVASLYSYYALNATRSELERVQADLSLARGEAERSRKVLAVVFSRDARFVKLSTTEQAPSFRAFWGPSSGLVLAGANVPAPAAGRTLQLWIVPKSGNPVSAGVFAPGANGQVLLIAESTQARIEDAAALAISDEPTGGSAQPTTKPVFVGTIGD